LPLTDWHPTYPGFKWASISLALHALASFHGISFVIQNLKD